MLVARNVSVRYPTGVEALSRVNLHVKRGEFVFLVGATGSGKSTLLKLFYREVAPTEGTVIVDQQDVTALPRQQVPLLRRRVGVVFQDYRLLPYKTARENVAFGLQVIGAEPRTVHMNVARALSRVGLTSHADAMPDQMSGGEQQRVSIARALVNEPAVLLADEPTGNLDPEMSLEVMQIISRVAETGTTVVVATHDRDIVNHFRKRVVEVEHGRIARDEQSGGYRSSDTLPLALPELDALGGAQGVPFADA